MYYMMHFINFGLSFIILYLNLSLISFEICALLVFQGILTKQLFAEITKKLFDVNITFV